jgi:hypothetical protein
MDVQILERRIFRLLLVFIGLLVLSGLTAFPLERELALLNGMEIWPKSMQVWISAVTTGLQQTNRNYPFLAYGTDWLAFAHLAIAVFFIGPLLDPVRNVWIMKAGMIISLAIFPLAFVAGSMRGIPFYWQLIDCSFGVFSFLLLGYCLKLVRMQENLELKKVTPRSLSQCPFAFRPKRN